MYYLTKILCILCLIGVTIGNKADYGKQIITFKVHKYEIWAFC